MEIVRTLAIVLIGLGLCAAAWSSRGRRAEDHLQQEEARLAAVEDTELVVAKLDAIHTLVNSSMTQAMQDALDSTLRVLALLEEKGSRDPAVMAEIVTTRDAVAELRARLTDRQST